MRVIAGTARRVLLNVHQESETRPFLEMARGALFNALAAFVPEARVLDLYAGSGALGIEALSRGAESAIFVEVDRKAQTVLRENLERCKLAGGRIMPGFVQGVLPGLKGEFDLIFLDPPFADAAKWETLPETETIVRETSRLLAPGGLLVFRFEQKKRQPPGWNPLELLRDRCYGRSRVCVYGRQESDGE
jgi:16S rRNA (guanine966-N2)-methyltransferase